MELKTSRILDFYAILRLLSLILVLVEQRFFLLSSFFYNLFHYFHLCLVHLASGRRCFGREGLMHPLQSSVKIVNRNASILMFRALSWENC